MLIAVSLCDTYLLFGDSLIVMILSAVILAAILLIMSILAALSCIDYVVVFNEQTPYELLSKLKPDILVKGGDYKIEDIVGKEFVKEVKTMAEEAKIALRNIRQDANNDIKKLELPEDEEKRGMDKVQDLISKYNKEVDNLLSEKEKELMTV